MKTSDEDTLKEIATRLVGRIEIEHQKPSNFQWEYFTVTLPSGFVETFVVAHTVLGDTAGRIFSQHRAWGDALNYARQHEGVIFGPPGYDVGL